MDEKLFFISSIAAIFFNFYFLIVTFGKRKGTTGAEELEMELERKLHYFFLRNPLERIPVSSCCASIDAGSAAPSLSMAA